MSRRESPVRLRHLTKTGPQLILRLERVDGFWQWRIDSAATRRPLAESVNAWRDRKAAIRNLEAVTGLQVGRHWTDKLGILALQVQPTSPRFYLIRGMAAEPKRAR